MEGYPELFSSPNAKTPTSVALNHLGIKVLITRNNLIIQNDGDQSCLINPKELSPAMAGREGLTNPGILELDFGIPNTADVCWYRVNILGSGGTKCLQRF